MLGFAWSAMWMGGGLRWLLLWLEWWFDLETEVVQLCDNFSPLFMRSLVTTCEALWPMTRMLWRAEVPWLPVYEAYTFGRASGLGCLRWPTLVRLVAILNN